MSLFQEKIYRLARNIPRGRVVTYAQLARAAGRPRAVRAVGNCMHRNPYAPIVPCHRVVRSNGEVGGFASGTAKKIEYLQAEGVRITKGKIDLVHFGFPTSRL